MIRKIAFAGSVLVALLHMGSEGACDRLSEGLFPVFNLFDVEFDDIRPAHRINLWRDVREGYVVLSFEEEDLLRKYVKDTRIAGVSNRNVSLSVGLPVITKRTRQWVKLLVSKEAFHYDGRSRGPDWTGRLGASGLTARLEYGVGIGRHRVAASVSSVGLDGNNQRFTIGKFPHSETDNSMNRFLLDLLEPTFGREVVYGMQDRDRGFEAGGILAVTERSRLEATVRLQDRKVDVAIRYINTGAKAELQGTRRVDLVLDLVSRRYVLAFEQRVRKYWLIRSEVGCTTNRMRLDLTPRDVPLSSGGVTLDLAELGNGSGSRRAVDLKVQGSWIRFDRFRLAMLLGWGRSSYGGEGAGTTPVLGFTFGVLPIAHRGEADLSGTIITWFGGSQIQKPWRRFRLDAGVVVARAKVENRTTADAQMEFGLYVRPVRDVAPYRLMLFRFYASPSVVLSRAIRVGYRATQHVAQLRGEQERVRLAGERTRGGTIHTLVLEYLF